MRFTLFLITVATLTCTTLAQNQSQDLTQLLQGDKNLTEFTKLLLTYGDIYANLSFQQDITILVPNNDAFNKIPYSSLGSAFENNRSDVVRSVLQYHILPGLHPTGSYNGSFSFNPTWLYNDTFTNVTGGQRVGAVAQPGNVNIVTSGLGSRSTLIEKDLKFHNGIVHSLDSFLIPPANFISTCPTFNLTAVGGAVVNTSLDEYVNTTPDVTIFAPNNDAFQKIGSALSDMSMEELTKVLGYHVVAGRHFVGYTSNLPNNTVLKTHQGGNLTVIFSSNSLFVNSARLLQQDILLSNGVMHIIDNVLDYNATDVKPVPTVPTAPAVIPGSALSDNIVPYATYLPTNITSYASATAGPSTFGVSDIGAGTSAFSTPPTSTAQATKKKTNAAGRVEVGSGGASAILGAALWFLGML